MDNVQQRVLTMSNIFTPFLNTSFRKGMSIFSHIAMWSKLVFLQAFIIICLAVGLGRSQSIKGTVSDEKTGDRLPFATVFFNNTSVVAETDADGNYWLKNLPAGNYQFIVRMMGYKTFTRPITIEKTTNFVLDIKLSAEEKVLEEIKITTKRDKSWEKQFKVFEKQFLGNFVPENASKIINPWVLDFTFEKGILIAKAQDVLEIHNPSLGYGIRYSLNTFRFDGSQVFFNGNAEFTNLFSNDSRQKSQWELKRLEAYRGSDIHLFKALKNQIALTEGFEFFIDKPGEDPSYRSPFFFQNQFKKLTKVSLDSSIRNISKNTYQLLLPGRVEIHFNRKEGAFSIYKDKPCQVAWIETNGQPLLFNEQGILLNPQVCSVSGYLTENRVANMLPIDYQPVSLPLELTPASEKTVRESIFFVTNRPYYYSNDLIQLSGTMYYSNPASADTMSSILHVELVNPTTHRIIVHQRLKVNKGRFAAEISLNDSLMDSPSRMYLLRAYTQWMRNFTDSAYSYRWLPIVSKNERLVQSTPVYSKEPLLLQTDLSKDLLQLKLAQTDLLWGSLSITNTEEVSPVSVGSRFTIDFDNLPDVPNGNFKLEKGIELSGKITNYKPSRHADIVLMLPKENLSFFTKIDKSGHFLFSDLPVEGNQTALIQVLNPKGKAVEGFEVHYDSLSSPLWLPTPPVPLKITTTDEVSNFSKAGINLEEVRIKTSAPPRPIASIYKEADYVVQGKDLYENAVGMNIISALQGRIPGLRIIEFAAENGLTKLVITMRMGASAGGFQKTTLPQPLVLVDGVPFDNINLISQIPVTQVERIEVVNRAEALTGLRGYIGVISIITKQSAKYSNLEDNLAANFKKAPIYGVTPEIRKYDFSLVYYWENSVPINQFLASGITIAKPQKRGIYNITFEGLTKDGKIIVSNKLIEVK